MCSKGNTEFDDNKSSWVHPLDLLMCKIKGHDYREDMGNRCRYCNKVKNDK